MKTRLLQHAFFAFLLVGSAGLWQCGRSNDAKVSDSSSSKPAELLVKVVPVKSQEWVVRVPITGSLHSQSIVTIKSEVGGKLLATYFEEGNRVRKNQLLAEIDPVNYRLAYDQAVASLSVAEAGLARARVMQDHARREKDRADNLLRTGGITEKDHQAADTSVRESETQVNFAEAQCQQARASLATAEKALKDCRILAPSEGNVYRKEFDRGSLIAPGSPLYTLVDNSRLELECLVPSYRLSEIRPGQRVEFRTPTWGDRPFDGTVSATNPMVENDNRSVKVFVRVANPKGELRSGMYARGEVEVRRESRALVIPRSTLIPEQEVSSSGSVFVVEKNLARRRAVMLGAIRQDLIWIQQGLQEGDEVIVEIGPSLKEGMPVRIMSKASAVVE